MGLMWLGVAFGAVFGGLATLGFVVWFYGIGRPRQPRSVDDILDTICSMTIAEIHDLLDGRPPTR